MSIRMIATLAVAIFLGLVAVFLTRGVIVANSKTADAAAAPVSGMVHVVVAAEPFARGQVLEAVNLKVVDFPATAVPAGTFSSVQQLLGGGTRLAMNPFVTNEPILSDKVSAPGGRLNMSAEIAPGMRGVSIKSSDVAGVGGFVLPGDRVDVMLTRSIAQQASNDSANTVTQVIAENVRVLAVDQIDDPNANKAVVAKAVTVEVTPDQAQEISLGDSVGTISLALRHVADSGMLLRAATTVQDLGFVARKPVAVHSSGGGVRVIRGADAVRQAYGQSVAAAAPAAAAAAAVP